MKKAKLLISLTFFCSVAFANDVGSEKCVLKTATLFGYTGDVSGKRLSTKEKYVYDCTKTIIKKDGCKRWKTIDQNIDISKINPTQYYISENYQGSIGEMLGNAQAYDKINGLWSGWHGICKVGIDDGAWDWMSDPYTLGGYALDLVGAYYAPGASSASEAAKKSAEEGAKTAAKTAATEAAKTAAKTTATSLYESAKNYAASAVSDLKESISSTINGFENGVSDTINGVKNLSVDTAKKTAQDVAKNIAKHSIQYGICTARAGLNIGKMISEYQNDGVACDPVDEFCDKEDTSSSQSENIFTVPEVKYNEMLKATPEAAKYMEVLDGVGTGVLTVKVVDPKNGSTTAAMKADMKAAKKEAKMMKLKVQAAMTTLSTASCISSAASGKSSNGSSVAGSMLSTKNLSVMALGMINPLIGLGVSVGMQVVDSVTSHIDTCNNLDDAKQKGSRHVATLKSVPLGMCHLVNVETKKIGIFGQKQSIYHYCCYDNKMTRVIVEQTKAQFAENWEHCTGVSLKELQNISFSACDPKGLDNGINGVNLPYDATVDERMKAYQFTHKCIDQREYKQAMIEMFGGDDALVDDSDIRKTLEDLK